MRIINIDKITFSMVAAIFGWGAILIAATILESVWGWVH